jgi:hypothetical protein
MKYLATLVLCAGLISTASESDASYKHRYRHVSSHHFGRYLASRHLHYIYRRRHFARRHHHRDAIHVGRRSLPGPCYTAAAMGGPCGCWAAYILLGRLDHVWHGINLWLANDWLRFPHVAASEARPGMAVVWPGRHVAPIGSNPRNGMIVVRDSWATHNVRLAGLVVVDPRGLRPKGALEFGPTGPGVLAFALLHPGMAPQSP